MSETFIKVENVSKKFCRSLKKSLWYGMKDLGSELVGRARNNCDDLRTDEFWAANDVSFELKRGECLGLIGRNGYCRGWNPKELATAVGAILGDEQKRRQISERAPSAVAGFGRVSTITRMAEAYRDIAGGAR